MAIKDYTKHTAPALQPLLAGEERLLAAAPLVKNPGTTQDVSVRDELKNLLDPTILVGLGAHPGNLVQAAVFGRAVIGAPGSTARRLFEAVNAVLSPEVAVTSTRLLIVELSTVPRGGGFWRRWFGPFDQVARKVHAVPRAAIVGAIPAPAGVLRRGRLLVGFGDGSGCMLVCSPPSLAAAVIDAIGAPKANGDADHDLPGEEPA